MAESRLIRRAILDSEKFNSLSWSAQNFYLRLLLVADDYGLCDARPVMLRCALYPLALDKVSESDVSSGLAACEDAGLVRCYLVEGKEYLQIANYGQRQRTAAKYPLPPWQGKNDRNLQQVAANCGRLQQNAAQTQTQSQTETQTHTQPQQCARAHARDEAEARGPATPAAAAAADGTYEKWREAMCRAFPTLRNAARLSEKVEAVAREAYGRLPRAAEKAELLAAYLDDRTPMDRYRNKFYRPVSQIKFFENLEDVVRHAELWQRETRCGERKARKEPEAKPKPKGPDDRPATEEEREEFMNYLRGTASGLAHAMEYNEAVKQKRQMTPAEEAEAKAEEAVEGMSEEEVKRFFNEIREEKGGKSNG